MLEEKNYLNKAKLNITIWPLILLISAAGGSYLMFISLEFAFWFCGILRKEKTFLHCDRLT